MRALIVGGGGQLGRALGLKLPDVISVERDELDITDYQAVREYLHHSNVQFVINTAAYTAVDKAEEEVGLAFRINTWGAKNLALATKETRMSLVHISTDYVFDGESDSPYYEDSPTNPLSIYGKSKLAGEEEVRKINPQHMIVRTSWLYGTQGHNFVTNMLKRAESGGIRVVTDQVGSPTYVNHLADGLHSLLCLGKFGTFHMAGGGRASWYELIKEVFDQLGLDVQVSPTLTSEFPTPAPRPRYSVLGSLCLPCTHTVLPHWKVGVQEFVNDYV
jgi:dTDP-4-dehydrorhamnose reductase